MRWIPADRSNYTNTSSRSIDTIVIHTIEGSEGGAISWFQNARANVSAHYIVSHSGRITQMLKDEDIGWHAGNWSYNQRSIGIENEGYAGRNNWTATQYRKLADLVIYLCHKHNIPKDRQHIIGHDEVPKATHWDPGPHFDWSRFMNLVRGSQSAGTGTSSSSSSTSTSTSTGTPFGVRVTASTLNVRDGVWGTKLGQVHSGDKFVVEGTSQGWYRISWQGRSAWISGNYATRIQTPAAKVTATALNVRTGPGTQNTKIGLTYKGQRYVRLGTSGSWYKIQFDSREGWVHSGYTDDLNLK